MFAQPTISSSNNPVVGDKLVAYVADSVGVMPGAGAPNTTWDFSNLQRISSKDSIISEFFSPASTGYASTFPTATLASRSVSGKSTGFVQADNEEVAILGFVDSSQGFTIIQ